MTCRHSLRVPLRWIKVVGTAGHQDPPRRNRRVGEALMGYANIMVSLDLSPSSADRVQLAAGLARRFEADLTGVAARPIPVPTALTNMQEDGILRAAEERRFSEELARTRDLFDREAGEEVRTGW